MGARLTLWAVAEGVSAQAAVEASPEADRGFGRKYLAHINPRWDVVALGDFPLNRSAAAGPGEFYIGGFAGLTVVQCEPESVTEKTNLSFDLRRLSTLPTTAWTRGVEHDHLYAIVMDEASSLGGFAHWHRGQLKRCFSATQRDIIEDIGLPEPFEAPYWAGEFPPEETGKLILPFAPVAFAAGAQNAWLGFPIEKDGPDVPVAGFAIDGRPVPKTSALGLGASVSGGAGRSASGSSARSRAAQGAAGAPQTSADVIFDDDPAAAMTRPVDELSDQYGDGDEITRTKNRPGWAALWGLGTRGSGEPANDGERARRAGRGGAGGRAGSAGRGGAGGRAEGAGRSTSRGTSGANSTRRSGVASRRGRGVGILSNEPGPGFAASARGEAAPFHANRPTGSVDANADHAFDLAGGYDEYADFDDYATSPTDANRQFTELDAERIGRGLRRAGATTAVFLGRAIVTIVKAIAATPGMIGDALRALARRGGRR